MKPRRDDDVTPLVERLAETTDALNEVRDAYRDALVRGVHIAAHILRDYATHPFPLPDDLREAMNYIRSVTLINADHLDDHADELVFAYEERLKDGPDSAGDRSATRHRSHLRGL